MSYMIMILIIMTMLMNILKNTDTILRHTMHCNALLRCHAIQCNKTVSYAQRTAHCIIRKLHITWYTYCPLHDTHIWQIAMPNLYKWIVNKLLTIVNSFQPGLELHWLWQSIASTLSSLSGFEICCSTKQSAVALNLTIHGEGGLHIHIFVVVDTRPIPPVGIAQTALKRQNMMLYCTLLHCTLLFSISSGCV